MYTFNTFYEANDLSIDLKDAPTQVQDAVTLVKKQLTKFKVKGYRLSLEVNSKGVTTIGVELGRAADDDHLIDELEDIAYKDKSIEIEACNNIHPAPKKSFK